MNSRDQLTDELLSAYLDGELTAEEVAFVERALSDEPAHRQTLEEMQSLRSEMLSLPRYRLDDQFAERVIRASREEREAVSVSGRAASPGVERAEGERTRGGRPIVYALMALAAALLVMLASSGRQGSDDPATRDNRATVERREEGDRPEADREGRKTRERETGALVAADARTGDERDSGDSPLASQSADSRTGIAARSDSDAQGLATTGTVRSPAEPAQPAKQPPQEAPEPARLASGRGAAADTQPTNEMPRSASARSESTPQEGGREAPIQIARADQSSGQSSGERDGGARANVGATADVPDAVGGHDAMQYLFVVHVELAPEGKRTRVFRNALQGHGIRFDTDLQVDDKLGQALLDSQMLARAGADREPVDANLYYVVATGQQVDSTVEHLGASNLVQRLHFDVAIRKAEVEVFRRLQMADARDRERREQKAGQAVEKLAEQVGHARRLLLDLAALNATVRQVASQGLLAASDPEDGGSVLAPLVGDEEAAPGANQLFEVLFVVRTR